LGGTHKKIRRHGKVHDLPEDIKKEVDRLLIEPGIIYDDIEEFLKKKALIFQGRA